MVCCVVDFAIDGFEIASGFACSEDTRRGEERRGEERRIVENYVGPWCIGALVPSIVLGCVC
jgi:hypothetical protein